MKCISLWQPWATLLVYGHKLHETRSWPTQVRGIVAIHAAKHKDPEGRVLTLEHPFCDALNGAEFDDLPFGCLLGTVRLVDCIRTEAVYPETLPSGWAGMPPDYFFGNFEAGRWAWKCDCPLQLAEPIPYRGEQGFFEVPDEPFEAIDPVLKEKWLDSFGELRG